MSWGLNADYDVVEDVSDLAASLQFATAELLAAAVEHVAGLEASKKAAGSKTPPTDKASGNGGAKTRKQAKKRPPMGTR